jgi:phage I-like protein
VNEKLPVMRINERTVAMLSATQRKFGFERIALDFEHNTVPDSPEFKRTKEPRPIAATGLLETVPGDGLYLLGIEWTPSGLENAANYPDLSPAVMCDADGTLLFVHSVALTRAGAGEGLRFATLSVESTESNEGASSMDPKLKAMLCKLLKLDADKASDDDVMSGLDACGSLVQTLSAEGGVAARIVTLNGAVEGGKTAIEALTAKIETLSADLVQVQREIVLGEARSDGKVIPLSAESIGAMDLKQLREMVSKLPAGVVPLSARTPRDLKVDGCAPVAGDAIDVIARRCGVDPAKVRAQK